MSILLGQCDCVQSQGSYSDMDLTFSSMMFWSFFTQHWDGGCLYTYLCHAACSHACNPNAAGLFMQFCTFPLEHLRSTQHLSPFIVWCDIECKVCSSMICGDTCYTYNAVCMYVLLSISQQKWYIIAQCLLVQYH